MLILDPRVERTDVIHFIADVIVHRLLAAALGLSKVPGALREKTMLTSVADSKLTRKSLIILNIGVKPFFVIHVKSFKIS